MIIPKPSDAKHKTQMYRLLREILQNNILANKLVFKGGTYAALRGVLDRFSVDLDFDLPNSSNIPELRIICHDIFKNLNLEVKDESKNHLQFFLKYEASEFERNTLKLEINDQVSKANKYEKYFLPEIAMYCNAHTLDTMFACKLIAAKARFDKNGKIAGRDFYDLHKFFNDGLSINKEVVEDLSNLTYKNYLISLAQFIEKEVSSKLLLEDLNPLLDTKKPKHYLKGLKKELLLMISDEIKRLD